MVLWVEVQVWKVVEDIVNEILTNEYNRVYDQHENQLNWLFKIEEIDKRDYIKDLQSANMLFNMGAMTPRQICESLGKPIGAIADPDNPWLDEYFIHGTPLSLMFKNAEMGESSHGLDQLHIQQQMWINELQARLGALQLGIDVGMIQTNAPIPTFDELKKEE